MKYISSQKTESFSIMPRVISLILILAFSLSIVGCGSSSQIKQNTPASDNPSATFSSEDNSTEASEAGPTAEPTPEATPMPTPTPEPTPDPVTLRQMNSISMLNYLVVFTQEINASRNSRIFLEKAYSELYNNTHPNAVDTRTQTEIVYLLNTIDKYKLINEKRERLEFLYEQERARAIHNAIPNPLGLLSATRSFSLTGLVTSVVYMAVDSYSRYEDTTKNAELQYLKDGWALDDEETRAFNEIQIGTFNYMMDTCRDYQLPGELALNMTAVKAFVERTNESNHTRVIRFLEDEESTYQAYGPYWLALAERYYNTKDYAQCLNSIARYESLKISIFRKDHMLAKMMPYAIDAASMLYSEQDYIPYAERCAAIIESQTENDEWALRYFAAQTFIDLAARTGDQSYLEKAYIIIRRNVNNLIDEQKALNAAYQGELTLAKEPEGATKAQKKDVKQYNEMLKKQRKTELPPISESLLLNCELLFALANQLNKPDSEKATIDRMLHDNIEPLFLVAPIDTLYWFNPSEPQDWSAQIELTTDELIVPADLVTSNAVITVTVKNGNDVTLFTDWAVSDVSRKNGQPFIVTYESAKANKFKFQEGMTAIVSIIPMEGSRAEIIEQTFLSKKQKKLVLSGIIFEKAEQ